MNSKSWRLTASLAFACGALAASQASAAVTATVLSSMPQLVTGEDALVQVSGATAAPTVTVGGKDVSAAFKKAANGNYIGLVTGLAKGNNDLAVTAGADKTNLTLVDHGINEALIAGPQQTPWVCEGDTFGLAKATTPDCATPPKITYNYKDKMGNWKAFDPAGARPGDIGTAKINGKDIPVIVRTEFGTINRGTYFISMLHDPMAGPVPTPTDRGGSAWAGKLALSFGPGVGAGYHSGRNFAQYSAPAYIEDNNAYFDELLTMGYATAGSSIAVFGTQPNDVLSAESIMKVKEHFIEEFGAPLFTIGQGPSGGSMQNQLIANAYPGILDGIMPERLFADEMTFLQPLYDCELLTNVFKTGNYTREQMQAVAGEYWGYCVSNGARYPRARTDGCDQVVYDAIAKDPAIAAKGNAAVRCTFQDNLVNIFGTDPKTGFARNPYDNQGVQYGLVALNSGKITVDQFVDINKRIGGHDVDGKLSPNRQIGDAEAVAIAYQTGRVVEETGGIKDTAFIDIRSYKDGDPYGRGDANVDVHNRIQSDIVRARIQKYTGTTANYVQILTAAAPPALAAIENTKTSPRGVGFGEGLAGLDKWLTAVLADTSTKTRAEKLAANRPKDLVDACYAIKSDSLDFTAVEKITDQNRCKQIFPTYSDPRMAAGAPLVDDVFKCTLKPVDAADYKTAPTADQLAALKTIFPAGVCDYTKPGVGQTQKITTWAVFSGNGKFAPANS
jgi:hypothetical protein